MLNNRLYELFYMDGHGIYVWSAYAITFLLFILLLSLPARKKRHLKKKYYLNKRIQQWENKSHEDPTS